MPDSRRTMVAVTSARQDPNRRPERLLAWLWALLAGVLVICVAGLFARPILASHFDIRSAELTSPAEVFVPPPQATTSATVPDVAFAEPSRTVAVPVSPDIVSPLAAVEPLTVAPMAGVVALRTSAIPALRPVSEPTRFVPEAGGSFPEPPYPRWARQQGMQGQLQLLVDVDTSGRVTDIKVRETCGHALLDQHVLDWVKGSWFWAPGAHRLYLVPFVFELK